MPPPDPIRLFEQADGLITAGRPEGPRQEDLRRAVSTAYYALFYFAATAAANMIVAEEIRSTDLYGLAYRSVDHAWLRTLWDEVKKPIMKAKWRQYASAGGFGAIAEFAATVLDLQELRNGADYDPLFRIEPEQAKIKVREARAAVELFEQSAEAQQKAFLFLLTARIALATGMPASGPNALDAPDFRGTGWPIW